jgi:hypothetical protein
VPGGPRGGAGRGGGLGRGDASPRHEGGGERGKQATALAGWAAPGSRPKGEGGVSFYFFYFLFSYNLLQNTYFTETKQLHTREIDVWLGMMQKPKKIFLGFSQTRSRAKSR